MEEASLPKDGGGVVPNEIWSKPNLVVYDHRTTSAGDELSCTSCAPPFHIFSYSSGVVSTSGEAAVHILCTRFLCDREGFLIRDSFGRGSLCAKTSNGKIFLVGYFEVSMSLFVQL
jgi:hypothetical protein